jgi:syntaxin-binding protein 1
VAAEAAQDRFEEDMILHSRSVSLLDFVLLGQRSHFDHIPRQILNLCATLGENPYIRYYQPQHHPPLGPLSVSKTPGSLYGGPSAPKIHPDELAAQQQTPRWKQALSGGSSGPSFSGDQIPKRLAMQIQKDLDEYKALNPDFPVSLQRSLVQGLHDTDQARSYHSQP